MCRCFGILLFCSFGVLLFCCFGGLQFIAYMNSLFRWLQIRVFKNGVVKNVAGASLRVHRRGPPFWIAGKAGLGGYAAGAAVLLALAVSSADGVQ